MQVPWRAEHILHTYSNPLEKQYKHQVLVIRLPCYTGMFTALRQCVGGLLNSLFLARANVHLGAVGNESLGDHPADSGTPALSKLIMVGLWGNVR